MKRALVVLGAIAMPAISYASNLGAFGPDNKTISGRYPTLLIAAGYAFSIWGIIFLLALAYAVWQARSAQRDDAALSRLAPWTAAGYVLTAIWSPLFSREWFIACLLVIFGAMGCMLYAATLATRLEVPPWVRTALSLHAGWLCLAAFLNVAQTLVAHRLFVDLMLPASLALFASATVILVVANHRMRGNVAFATAAVWALVAVFIKQRASSLGGSSIAAWTALGIAVGLVAQTAGLRLRARVATSA